MYYKVFKKFLVLSIYAVPKPVACAQNKAAKREARSAKLLSIQNLFFLFSSSLGTSAAGDRGTGYFHF